MKFIMCVLVVFALSGCIYKETTTNNQGIVTEDKYIIKRPLKDFVENVEFE